MTARVAIAYGFNDRDWFGGKNYFSSLFRAIEAANNAAVQPVLFIGLKTVTTLPEEFPSLEVVRTPAMDRLHPLWLMRQVTLRGFSEDPILARVLEKKRIDLLSHSGQLGVKATVRTAPWLYDFQFMHLPELWKKRHIDWARQRYDAACRNGDAILVSSGQALSDLALFAPWCTKPRHVLRFVSNPVNFSKLPGRREICAKYSLPDDFLYLPNQFWANKNHITAIDALVELRSRGIGATIVCSGQTFDGRQPKYFDELMAYRARVGMVEMFRVLGVVPYLHAQALMAHSRAVINPSRFEGWSTTVEEAKTMQKTLLLSDLPVHREQCPSYGRFFDPNDPTQLASLMEEVLQSTVATIDTFRAEADYLHRLEAFGRTYLDIVRSVLA